MIFVKELTNYIKVKKNIDQSQREVRELVFNIAPHLHLLSEERYLQEATKLSDLLESSMKYCINTMLVDSYDDFSLSVIEHKVYLIFKKKLEKRRRKSTRENLTLFRRAYNKDMLREVYRFIETAEAMSSNNMEEYLNSIIVDTLKKVIN